MLVAIHDNFQFEFTFHDICASDFFQGSADHVGIGCSWFEACDDALEQACQTEEFTTEELDEIEAQIEEYKKDSDFEKIQELCEQNDDVWCYVSLRIIR